jgi:5-hydroxyisourate hydrolase
MVGTDLYSHAATLTTHALDIAAGKPASGLPIHFSKVVAGERKPIVSVLSNANGRCDGPLLTQANTEAGIYLLEFDACSYHGKPSPFGLIPVEFNISDPDAHYHVPLVFAPGGYSTYRGAPPSRLPNDKGQWGAIRMPSGLPGFHSAPSTGGTGLSLHVIDIACGVGAGGLTGVLRRREKTETPWKKLNAFTVNGEGRTDHWLVSDGDLVEADYEMVFDVGNYYRTLNFGVGEPAFFARVRIRLQIHDRRSHHHIAMLLSPWGYSCYRGS